MAKIEYKRLTRGRSRRTFAVALMSRTSLWLGPDHLLFVDSNGYTETYKRFYFRDIQAFVVQRTSAATTTNIVLTVMLVFALVPALAVQSMGGKIFCFTLAGLFALIMLVNLLLGQTCRCFLRTAVQTEQLPPLNRVRGAQKVFARLRPLIAAAQGGELTASIISDRMREQVQSASVAVAAENDPGIPPRLVP